MMKRDYMEEKRKKQRNYFQRKGGEMVKTN